MSKRIIFQTAEGGVAVIIPSEEALAKYSINQIAQKDVPAGFAYRVIDATDLPADRTFRDAWEVDPAILNDGVGSESDTFE